jgi:type I restriction enzyme S subunit
MSDFKTQKFSDLGHHYGGLTNKRKEDFGHGKPYIPYLNIFENAFIDPSWLEYVNVRNGEHQNQVKKGDMFFTTSSETAEEVGMTSVLLHDLGEVYLNSFCFGFRLNDFKVLLPEYAGFVFRSERVRKQISNLAQGSTRYNLSKSIFFDKLRLTLPSISHQRKIARILAKVDRAISQTGKAIEKLKKIKQGMMHDLFTRGIDVKTGKLRPSYSEAPELYKDTELGWIPEEWGITCLGDDDKFELRTGGTPSTARPEYWVGEIPWMSSGEVHKKRIYYVDNTISELGYKNSNAYVYPINTIVIALAGQGKTRGTVALTYVETTSNQSIVGIICRKGNPLFFYFLLDSQYEQLRSASAGAGRAGLSIGILSKYSVFYPDIKEQELISNKLDSIDKKIDNEINYLQKKKLLKQGLMQDLLTGKVEVIHDSQDKEYQEVS